MRRSYRKGCGHRGTGRRTRRGGFIAHKREVSFDTPKLIPYTMCMTWERIFSILFSAFVIKAVAACVAIYIGIEVASYVNEVFAVASETMERVKK